MCTVFVRISPNSAVPVVVASNRDEFLLRPSAAMNKNPQGFYAGTDLKGGGAWFGFNPANGHFATVLNVRSKVPAPEDPLTRGTLVQQFLTQELSPVDYFASLDLQRYDGFNLVLGNAQGAYVCSNRDRVQNGCYPLAAGDHAFSNDRLSQGVHPNWFKCEQILKDVGALDFAAADARPEQISQAVFEALNNSQKAPKSRLPDTGVSEALEFGLSSLRVKLPGYGTRTSQLLVLGATAFIAERTLGTKNTVLFEF